MATKVMDPMEEVRRWKREVSRELNEARRKGKLLEKLKEIERRHEKTVQRMKKAHHHR